MSGPNKDKEFSRKFNEVWRDMCEAAKRKAVDAVGKALAASTQEAREALTYPMPAHGWTCFHCGETFRVIAAARNHFGETPVNAAHCLSKLAAPRPPCPDSCCKFNLGDRAIYNGFGEAEAGGGADLLVLIVGRAFNPKAEEPMYDIRTINVIGITFRNVPERLLRRVDIEDVI
jgi:hypothetical protein